MGKQPQQGTYGGAGEGRRHAVSRQELAENSEIIITMLPNGPQVKEVMLGDVVNYMHAGQIFIDCSSISPVASKEIAAVLAEKGIEMLDAPVSGGEPKAVDGTLSFMVGGKQAVFDICKDVLAAMGASVTLCGDVGAGNTTKLANQIIVALQHPGGGRGVHSGAEGRG